MFYHARHSGSSSTHHVERAARVKSQRTGVGQRRTSVILFQPHVSQRLSGAHMWPTRMALASTVGQQATRSLFIHTLVEKAALLRGSFVFTMQLLELPSFSAECPTNVRGAKIFFLSFCPARSAGPVVNYMRMSAIFWRTGLMLMYLYTKMYTYIYMYMYVYVCVCVCAAQSKVKRLSTDSGNGTGLALNIFTDHCPVLTKIPMHTMKGCADNN